MLLITRTQRAATMIAAILIGGVLVGVAAVSPSSGAESQYIGWFERQSLLRSIGALLRLQNRCSVCHVRCRKRGRSPWRPNIKAPNLRS